MAILNCTPDSFFAASRLASVEQVVRQAEHSLADGAAILDLGGCSTRPGAEVPSLEEEWARLSEPLRAVREAFPDAVLSVDTFRAEIARRAVEEAGVDIINDVTAGEADPEMFSTVASLHVAYVLTHMHGMPQTMQQLTDYADLMSDVFALFAKRLDELHRLGVADVLLDPGFGFAKTVEQNFELLRRLSELEIFSCPLLIGLSRKSMLWRTIGATPEQSLEATTAAHMAALMGGAKILRVHDVRAARDTINIYKALRGANQ